MPKAGDKILGKVATPWDVSRCVRRISNWLLTGKITSAEASALNGLLRTNLKCIELIDVEKKIEVIEAELEKIRGRNA